jgi:hypothetical protein
MVDKKAFLAELSGLSESEIRRRLAQSQWSEEEAKLAQDHLEERLIAVQRAALTGANTRATLAIVISAILAIAAVVAVAIAVWALLDG